MSRETSEIYDLAAKKWVRHRQESLSDFTGRPALFDACGDVAGQHILDLGCGEGYCARIFAERGAQKIEGIDISEKMVSEAELAASGDRCQNFQSGDITKLPYDNEEFDLAVGCFVYNYLSIDEMCESFAEVRRVLKNSGKFIFCVPHPAFPFIRLDKDPPFFFDFGSKGYFSARDQNTQGKIWRRDNQSLPVEMHHKLISDYFSKLAEVGFSKMPLVRELGVDEDLMRLDNSFFGPLFDIPLHMLFSVQKN